MENNTAVLFRRDTRKKIDVNQADIVGSVATLLKTIQEDMHDKARRERDSRISVVTKWEEFLPELDKGNLVLAPWCEESSTEEWVKATTKEIYRRREIAAKKAKGDEVEKDDGKGLSGSAKTLCIPFAQPAMSEGQLCFTSHPGSPGEGKKARVWCLWGRSY